MLHHSLPSWSQNCDISWHAHVPLGSGHAHTNMFSKPPFSFHWKSSKSFTSTLAFSRHFRPYSKTLQPDTAHVPCWIMLLCGLGPMSCDRFLIDITQAFLKSPVHTYTFSFETHIFYASSEITTWGTVFREGGEGGEGGGRITRDGNWVYRLLCFPRGWFWPTRFSSPKLVLAFGPMCFCCFIQHGLESDSKPLCTLEMWAKRPPLKTWTGYVSEVTILLYFSTGFLFFRSSFVLRDLLETVCTLLCVEWWFTARNAKHWWKW